MTKKQIPEQLKKKAAEKKGTVIDRPRRKDPSHQASTWCVADRMRENYTNVFQTKIASKQVVDIVLATMGQILEEQGYLCLRGIGTIRTIDSKPAKESAAGVAPAKRKRLSIATSWSMLDRLNPDNPKRKKRG